LYELKHNLKKIQDRKIKTCQIFLIMLFYFCLKNINFINNVANIKSARKRIGVTKRNNLKNKYYMSNIKTFVKKYLVSLIDYKNSNNITNFEKSSNLLNLVYSKLDKATKVKVLHKNTAARKKSNLKRILNNIPI
jgi:small subunit ribosomal protein S20